MFSDDDDLAIEYRTWRDEKSRYTCFRMRPIRGWRLWLLSIAIGLGTAVKEPVKKFFNEVLQRVYEIALPEPSLQRTRRM